MKFTEFSAATLTEEQAQQIAEAYVKGDKEPPRIAAILRVDSFDLNLIMHPMVRSRIILLQEALSPLHSLEDHVTKLKEIRDAALDDENFKIALQAETQLGKAVGIYDPKPIGDEGSGSGEDETKLSTTELRRRLAKVMGATPNEDLRRALPAPEVDDDEDHAF